MLASRTIYPLTILIFFCLLSCGGERSGNKVDQEGDMIKEPQMTDPVIEESSRPEHLTYFTASGIAPVWSLEIAEDRIVFESSIPGLTRLFTPHEDPEQAMDANVKRYRLETESRLLEITIRQRNCGETPAESLPYSVDVNVESAVDNKVSVSGCGNYIPDYRLYDIWALRSIAGEDIIPENYGNTIPRLEINTKKRTFMAFAGCNDVQGQIFTERRRIRFTNLETTLQACPGNAESDFIIDLRKVIKYEFKDRFLYLETGDGSELVLQKVD